MITVHLLTVKEETDEYVIDKIKKSRERTERRETISQQVYQSPWESL